MKKLVKILLVALLACACLAACDGETGGNDEEKVSFGFVTDIGGIDDKSFNQTSWEGAKKFADEVGLVEGTDYKYLQSDSESDYAPNLTTFADEEVD